MNDNLQWLAIIVIGIILLIVLLFPPDGDRI